MPFFLKIAKYAKLTPDKIAINFAGTEVSYQTLYQRAKKLHLALFSLPCRHKKTYNLAPNGRLVLVLLPNHALFAEIFAAASQSPHCISILSPKTPYEQIAEIIKRLQADVIIVEKSNQFAIDCAQQAGIFTIEINDDNNAQQAYDAFCQKANLSEEIAAIDYPNHPFFIGFTSGTTGLPKAFIRNRVSWRQSLQDAITVFNLKDQQISLACGPLAHGVSLYAMAEALYMGARFLNVKDINDQNLIAFFKKAHRFIGVPSQLALLAKKAHEQKMTFTHIKQFVSAAAKFEAYHWQLARKLFPNAEILQYYGASELGFIAVNKMNKHIIEQNSMMSVVGHAFPNVKVTIRDNVGTICQAGEIGTIFVESKQIALKYLWGDDGQSLQKTNFGATVYDLGMKDKNDLIYVLGRAGNMIISGGNNIYLAEIETALKKLAFIREACCFGLKDKIYGERLVAILELTQEKKVNRQNIEQACLEFLPKYKIPKSFYHIDKWPMTFSGKIAREKTIAEVERLETCNIYKSTIVKILN